MNENQTVFVHAGGLGDIIYSLHFVKTYLKTIGQDKAKFYLEYGAPGNMHHSHPFGNTLMTKGAAEWFKSFLETQTYISSVEIVEYGKYEFPKNEKKFDLNLFRKLPLDFRSMYIPRWYYYVIPCFVKNMSFNEPWITLGTDDRTKDKIVIFRSSRYQNKFVDYSFLNEHRKEFVFIGLDAEYNEFKKMIDCERIEIKSALEAANLIGSAKLIIGNQTFFYSLAEAAKKDRLCELSNYCPNTYAHGGTCNDILFTEQFKIIMDKWFVDNKKETK